MNSAWPGLAQWVEHIEMESNVALFNRLTGRSIVLPRGVFDHPPSPPMITRLQREWMWAEGPHLEWETLIPCKSKRVLYLPRDGALWVPVAHHHTSGGFGYRALKLSPTGEAIWCAINDSRSILQVAQTCRASILQIQAFCGELCAPDLQVLQLRTTAPRPNDPALQRLIALPRPDNVRDAHVYGTSGETDLIHYHLHEITDGSTHFDNRETTVAHAFGLPHPALGGLSFGARLYAQIHQLRPLRPTDQVVEVGCGTGEMSMGWHSAIQQGAGTRYARIDLSPELLRTQQQNSPTSLGVLGNATALPLANDSVDVLLSNEVIADLAAVPLTPGVTNEASQSVMDDLQRYGLPKPHQTTLYNQGTWRFIEEIARVLRPGGLAYVSEFGSPTDDPEEATQLDHPEVSIQFGVLAHIAQQLNLTPTCIPMADFLGVDLHQLQPSRISWMALRALAASQNRHLPARAWQPDDIQSGGLFPFPVEGVQWVPLSSEGPGPLVTRFWVLILRKPEPNADRLH